VAKEDLERDDDPEATLGDGELGRKQRIRCPCCRWEPRDSDRWQCSCLHLWNTFHTRGVCPGCGHAWKETQCPRCHRWSPHEAWYVEES
jgi:hypothetical protein